MKRSIVMLALTLFVVGCDDSHNITGPTPPPPQPPVINAFTADATRLATSTLDTFLRWDVAGSTDTRCRIDSPGQPSQGMGNVPLGGFVQVRPFVSREYTLVCSNSAGTALRMLFIFIG